MDYKTASAAHHQAAIDASTPEARQVHSARSAVLLEAYLKSLGE